MGRIGGKWCSLRYTRDKLLFEVFTVKKGTSDDCGIRFGDYWSTDVVGTIV